ncbi:hypothetical protein [Paracoccus sp. NSM]|uniref:hypothetical protein n=1 Tax=Paracoccus sp. NSM TaxID=3457784 RepID=UPI004035CC5C
MIRITIAAAALLGTSLSVHAAGGDLATQPIALDRLEIGQGDTGFGVSVSEYQMQTGQAYSLQINAVGWHECNWEAPSFFKNAWLRKIEAGGMEIKVPSLNELEMSSDGEAELYFVPIRPGTYKWGCRGLEDRGLTGVFIVQ